MMRVLVLSRLTRMIRFILMMRMLFMLRGMTCLMTMFQVVVIFLFTSHFFQLPYLRTALFFTSVSPRLPAIVNAAAFKIHFIFSISDLIVSNSSRSISPRA